MGPHCLPWRLLKNFSRREKQTTFGCDWRIKGYGCVFIHLGNTVYKYGWNHRLDNNVINLYLMVSLSYKHTAQMVKETQLYQHLRFINMIFFTMYTSTTTSK